MVFAKMLKEEEDGFTVLMNKDDYEWYIAELAKWLEENQDKISKNREKPIKQFVLTDEKQ